MRPGPRQWTRLQTAQRLSGLLIVALVLSIGAFMRMRRYRNAPHVMSGAAVPATLESVPFELTEASRQTGLLHVHQKFIPHRKLHKIGPYLSALAGASVAVTDFDNDGWPDVYLTNAAVGSQNKLWRNNHDGTFTDVAAKAGLADVNRRAGSLRALFFDYDHDGHKDLLINTTFCPKVFHNDGGTFRDVSEKSGIDHCGYSTASNLIDYDNDGYLDVVIADYFKPVDLSDPATTKFMWNRIGGADNGGPILIYRNDRDGTFSRVPGSLGIKSRGFTQAVGVYHLAGTKLPDLFFATDFNVDQIYFNAGKGRFTDASERLGLKYRGFGMNSDAADLDDDGRPTIFVSKIYVPGHEVAGNTLLKMTADGPFVDVAAERGVDRCGWAWGAKFLDLDNDGRLDLVVANGLLSASKKKDYWFEQDVIEAAGAAVMEDADLWPAVADKSLAGYQKKCVFYNVGGRMADVTDQTALKDDFSDGRGVAAIDYLNNGSLAFVEANVGQPARFYRNEQKNRNHWIGFELTGTRSNRDAWGSVVTVKAAGRTMTRELQPANGYLSQSDSRLHFGLGPDAKIESVEVRWPSGRTQTLPAPAPNRYHKITEPR